MSPEQATNGLEILFEYRPGEFYRMRIHGTPWQVGDCWLVNLKPSFHAIASGQNVPGYLRRYCKAAPLDRVEPYVPPRVPQRFSFRDSTGVEKFGLVSPCSSDWEIWTSSGAFSLFVDDPPKELERFLGSFSHFRWIDNDYNWPQLPVNPGPKQMGGGA